jgi:hypothetical protein
MAVLPVTSGVGSGSAGTGHWELKITNGDARDAAVIVVDLAQDAEDRLVYVRAGASSTMGQITQRSYRVAFQFGRNWDTRKEEFLCDRTTEIFDKPLTFAEAHDSDKVRFKRHRVTLTQSRMATPPRSISMMCFFEGGRRHRDSVYSQP